MPEGPSHNMMPFSASSARMLSPRVKSLAFRAESRSLIPLSTSAAVSFALQGAQHALAVCPAAAY